MNGFIRLRKKKAFRLCRSTSCNFVPKWHIFFRDTGMDSSVESWLSCFLENMLSLMRCGNSQAWSFLRISAAVFIGDWDKAEHSASKHLLARCRMPDLQRSPTWAFFVCVCVCTCVCRCLRVCVCDFPAVCVSISVIGHTHRSRPCLLAPQVWKLEWFLCFVKCSFCDITQTFEENVCRQRDAGEAHTLRGAGLIKTFH